MSARAAATACAVAVLVAGCEPAVKEPAPVIRPVRTVAVERGVPAATMTFAGLIEAQDQPSLSFRISGRIAERPAAIGARVKAGDVVARLDAENELNALRSAQARLVAAQSALRQAEGHYGRQSRLIRSGDTTVADHEEAAQRVSAARARVEAVEAQLRNAEDVVGFTTLRADAPGIVVATGAEAGEVVSAGQMVVRLARQDGRDAVFDVPAEALHRSAESSIVEVSLAGAPEMRAQGRIRERAPEADPVTRTFRIRVGLADPPPAFRLGASVTGRISFETGSAISIPAGALVAGRNAPTVWVVDPGAMTVAARELRIASGDGATVAVLQGLEAGDIVVTAGANLLRDGQKVRPLTKEPR